MAFEGLQQMALVGEAGGGGNVGGAHPAGEELLRLFYSFEQYVLVWCHVC